MPWFLFLFGNRILAQQGLGSSKVINYPTSPANFLIDQMTMINHPDINHFTLSRRYLYLRLPDENESSLVTLSSYPSGSLLFIACPFFTRSPGYA
jgi:hypothetical protein